eukprot:CAMPEP_0198505282 /NCGR_PEP_ID=MMETSP1462-20131121/10923_1 /TAXON_ID=1333877 /ORGANISM="Brandtodinium nutriculum, Strain RCC3387" /LENGTH=130 /DNA_ID=CAMNT_0044234455 /DNA_START=38 /DNA_END=427 /DNA_ORIENTATION=+
MHAHCPSGAQARGIGLATMLRLPWEFGAAMRRESMTRCQASTTADKQAHFYSRIAGYLIGKGAQRNRLDNVLDGTGSTAGEGVAQGKLPKSKCATHNGPRAARSLRCCTSSRWESPERLQNKPHAWSCRA